MRQTLQRNGERNRHASSTSSAFRRLEGRISGDPQWAQERAVTASLRTAVENERSGGSVWATLGTRAMVGDLEGRPFLMIVVTFEMKIMTCLAVGLSAGMAFAQPADLVLRNGKLVTLEKSAPEEQGLAARGGKIVAVGSNKTVDGLIGRMTRVIDLQGRLAIPGLIEGHGHFTALGASKMTLDLRGARNWDQIVAMVVVAAREAKAGDVDSRERLSSGQMGSAAAAERARLSGTCSLSRISPRNPVWLTHASGHAGFANAEAMRQAGIDKDTPDPEGGEILRDSHGDPTGLMNERAQDLIQHVLDSYRARRTPAEAEAELGNRSNWRSGNVCPRGSRRLRMRVRRSPPWICFARWRSKASSDCECG